LPLAPHAYTQPLFITTIGSNENTSVFHKIQEFVQRTQE